MAIQRYAQQLRAQAQADRHRHCLLLAGQAAWCTAQAQSCLAEFDRANVLWLSPQPEPSTAARPTDNCTQMLGQEYAAIVFDAHRRFDADAFGIACGCVKAGGLLLLLTPPPPSQASPSATRSYFHARVARVLFTSGNVNVVHQHQPPPPIPTRPHRRTARAPHCVYASAEQQQAVAAIKKVVHGQRRRPTLILSDRGRGKSAALGIAASELSALGYTRLIVTSQHRAATGNVFKHAHPTPTNHLRFMPVDALLKLRPHCDLLMVDEAASLPLPLLGKLLAAFSRIAFASTVTGYEGSGQALNLTFNALLQQHTRGWRTLTLLDPLRWAEQDPLENLSYELLLLKPAVAAAAPAVPQRCAAADIRFEPLTRARLLEDEALLQQVFGLLLMAHYRSRPADLAHLLDAPNLRLFHAHCGQQTVAVASVLSEAALDAALAAQIYRGQRRPGTKLLLETLCGQLGIVAAGQYSAQRISRIVVQPSLRRRGIGSRLLQFIAAQPNSNPSPNPNPPTALLGASFSAAAAAVNFWHKNAFKLVRIGLRLSKATATPACLVLRLTHQSAAAVYQQSIDHFLANFPDLLAHQQKYLAAEIVLAALRGHATNAPRISNTRRASHRLDEQDKRLLHSIAHATVNPDNHPAVLKRLGLGVLLHADHCGLTTAEATLLVERVLQKRAWHECSNLAARGGKRAGLELLRQAVGKGVG